MRSLISLIGTFSLIFWLPACDGKDPDCEDDLSRQHEGDIGEAELAGLCDDGCERTVNGSVTLDNTALTNLDDLSCVTEITGDLYIRQNEALSSIAGLSALKTVGGQLSVGEYSCEWTDQWVCTGSGNPALVSYDGLQNLESVGGWLFLADNDLVGDPGVSFDRLASIGDSAPSDFAIRIDGHANLTTLPELPLITHPIPGIEIWGNDALVDLAGLSALQEVLFLNVLSNPSLEAPLGLDALQHADNLIFAANGNTSMQGLEALETVDAALEFWTNDNLISYEGLNNLVSIGYWMHVIDNDALTDLRGLDSLTTIGMELNIFDNDALVSVDGVESLTTLGGSLQIMGYVEEGNPSLTDLKGLYGLESVSADVTIRGNTALPDAEAWALVDEIETIGGAVTIEGNGG